MNFMSVKDAAVCWNVSERWVQKLCEDGRILEAKKFGRSWMIPSATQKPSDPRRSIKQKGKENE